MFFAGTFVVSGLFKIAGISAKYIILNDIMEMVPSSFVVLFGLFYRLKFLKIMGRYDHIMLHHKLAD